MILPIMTALPGERRGYVDGPEGQLHYRSFGEGVPVLLIHQAPWSSLQFRHALPRIADAGFRAIAVDLPGHGMSDPPRQPSIECYADCLAALLRELNATPAIVIGHRGGGLVAGRLAAEEPELVKFLILDNAPLYTVADRQARIGKFPDRQDIAPDGSHITDRWAWVREKGDPDWSDETVHISVITYFLHGPWKEHGHGVIPLYDFERDVPRISCPGMVIASRTDPVFPFVRKLAEHRQDWAYAELPGGPGMVLDRIDEWWAAVRGPLVSVT
ncbi:alpha/beta fold hydrolase [Croceicoccus estronivorus]|uniref:alpha/beta fold hydrolase n=1 Tax=Croceicoccus estronivorus TaxID=1172626 RepID=UPI000A61E2CE|nr:alpha/beta hydrolase [Croceicoccus estronivorus]